MGFFLVNREEMASHATGPRRRGVWCVYILQESRVSIQGKVYLQEGRHTVSTVGQEGEAGLLRATEQTTYTHVTLSPSVALHLTVTLLIITLLQTPNQHRRHRYSVSKAVNNCEWRSPALLLLAISF